MATRGATLGMVSTIAGTTDLDSPGKDRSPVTPEHSALVGASVNSPTDEGLRREIMRGATSRMSEHLGHKNSKERELSGLASTAAPQPEILEAEKRVQLDAAIARIAKRDAVGAFTESRLREQMLQALIELKEITDSEITQGELEQIMNQLLAARNAERQALMLREIADAGRGVAELGSQPSGAEVNRRLMSIRAKYADVEGVSSELVKNTFATAHDREYERKLSQVSWASRKYYGMKQFVSSSIAWVSESVSSASTWATDMVKSVKDSIVSAAATAKDIGVGIAKVAKDVGSAAIEYGSKAGHATAQFVKKVVADPLGAARDVSAAVKSAAIAVRDGAQWVVEKGSQAITWVAENGVHMLEKAGELVSAVVQGDYSKAWEMVKVGAVAAWNFGDSLVTSLGLKDAFWGAVALVRTPFQLAYDIVKVMTGQGTFSDAFNNLKSNLAEIGQGVVGCLKCLGDLTGVTDAALAVYHGSKALAAYGRGDNAAAAQELMTASMHGAFAVMSWGTLAATVATGGVAAGSMVAVMAGRVTVKEGAKVVLKKAAKEFLEAGANEIGSQAVKAMSGEALKVVSKEMGASAVKELEQQALKDLGKGASKEALQATVEKLALQKLIQAEGRVIAEAGGEQLVKEIATHGSKVVAPDVVQGTLRDIAEHRTKDLLKKLKLTDKIDELSYDLLNNVRHGRTKPVTADIAERFGVSKKEASAMVKDMRKALASSKSDEAMKETLEKGISKHVTGVIEREMEQSFKTHFRRGLTGQLDTAWSKELREAVEKEAKRLGKKNVDEYADELVEAGWTGVREGIQKATKGAVREGIERAFKRLRSVKVRAFTDVEKDSEIAKESENLATKMTRSEQGRLGDVPKVTRREGDALKEFQQPEIRRRVVVKDDGSTVEIVGKYDDQERLLSQSEQVLSNASKKVEKKSTHDVRRAA